MFVVDGPRGTYLFDCPFDIELDDYPPEYKVYLLAADTSIPSVGSWNALTSGAKLLARVRVDDVRFDATCRAAIDPIILESLPSC
jgi:hypothetical protein